MAGLRVKGGAGPHGIAVRAGASPGESTRAGDRGGAPRPVGDTVPKGGAGGTVPVGGMVSRGAARGRPGRRGPRPYPAWFPPPGPPAPRLGDATAGEAGGCLDLLGSVQVKA